MTDDVEFSGELLGELLNTAINDHGFEAPIRIAAVAVNNSTVVGVYVPGEDGSGLNFKLIAQKSEGAGFALPINIMIADSRGEALHVKLEKGYKKPKLTVVH